MTQRVPIWMIASLLVGGALGSQGYAQTIFDETYTGADLAAFPSLTTRPISVMGSVLNVGAGSIGFERLLEIPIVSAGALAANQEVSISLTLTESPPPGANTDHDFYVGVTDGEFYAVEDRVPRVYPWVNEPSCHDLLAKRCR